MKMTCGVYEIVNKETNQSYIGRSINIESRWVAHKSSPTDNMYPTIELYETNPKMVEFKIIREINEEYFNKEELKFITSACELYEINQRGGSDSDNLINMRDGDILACPPSILSKREMLPNCIDVEDILYGIEKWANDVYRFETSRYLPPTDYKGKPRENAYLYWFNKHKELENKNEELNDIIESLRNELERYKPYGVFEDSINHSLEYREKMATNYEYFKLKKENAILSDEKEELESKVSFWKEKCLSWRDKFFKISERLCKK